MTTVNLTSIYMTSILGILMTITWVYASFWRFKSGKNSREDQLLLWSAILVIVCCLADMLCSSFDGKPGTLAFCLNYLGNMVLFLSELVFPVFWVHFLMLHLFGRIEKKHACILNAVVGICALLLVINFFTPIVFGIGENNIYFRGPGYTVFLLMNLAIMLDSVNQYIVARKKGGFMKFFPILIFLLPILIGVTLQFFFYGVAMIEPCLGISLCGVTLGLSGEKIYRDRLTGLYNRSYLEDIKEKAYKFKSGTFTAVMMDINDFKSINDTMGHSVGDDALRMTALILRENVGAGGSVIRYGGDEFMILLNTRDEEEAKALLTNIQNSLNSFNARSDRKYKLNLSMGYCPLDLEKETLDEIFEEVDRRMYEDKAKYYSRHSEIDRRV